MNNHKEQGSVLGYVLVGLLLLGLLVGGALLFKNNTGMFGGSFLGQTDSKDASDGESDKQTPSTTENSQNTDQAAQNEAALKKQQEEAAKKSQEQAAASAAQANNGTVATQVPVTSTAPAALPQTGPAEDFALMAVMSGLLAGSIFAYHRSRIAL